MADPKIIGYFKLEVRIKVVKCNKEKSGRPSSNPSYDGDGTSSIKHQYD